MEDVFPIWNCRKPGADAVSNGLTMGLSAAGSYTIAPEVFFDVCSQGERDDEIGGCGYGIIIKLVFAEEAEADAMQSWCESAGIEVSRDPFADSAVGSDLAKLSIPNRDSTAFAVICSVYRSSDKIAGQDHNLFYLIDMTVDQPNPDYLQMLDEFEKMFPDGMFDKPDTVIKGQYRRIMAE